MRFQLFDMNYYGTGLQPPVAELIEVESESAVEEGTAITDSVLKEAAIFGITAVRILASGYGRRPDFDKR
jgi:hypothetical protein